MTSKRYEVKEIESRDKAQQIVIESSITAGYTDSAWIEPLFKHELTERITAELTGLRTALEVAQKDHQLTIGVFRQQERIWEQKLKRADQSICVICGEIVARDIERGKELESLSLEEGEADA